MAWIAARRLALLVLLATAGCSSGPTTGNGAADRGSAKGLELHRYDDSRLTADAQRAVRAATVAVLDGQLLPPDPDRAFRYTVGEHDDGWYVTVWHVRGFFEDGTPQFVPGGHTGVQLDGHLKVKSVMPGA